MGEPCSPREVCHHPHRRVWCPPGMSPPCWLKGWEPPLGSTAFGKPKNAGTEALAPLPPCGWMSVEHILTVFGALGHFNYLRNFIGHHQANLKKKNPVSCNLGPRRGWFFQSYKVSNFCVLSIPFHFYLQSIQFFLELISSPSQLLAADTPSRARFCFPVSCPRAARLGGARVRLLSCSACNFVKCLALVCDTVPWLSLGPASRATSLPGQCHPACIYPAPGIFSFLVLGIDGISRRGQTEKSQWLSRPQA